MMLCVTMTSNHPAVELAQILKPGNPGKQKKKRERERNVNIISKMFQTLKSPWNFQSSKHLSILTFQIIVHLP